MATDSNRSRVLIIVFDALRPDMVSDTLMPNLSAFAANGVRYANSRSVFPSETRVNQASLVTGCYPGKHGIVANKFVHATANPTALFNTGDEDALRIGDERLGGALLLTPAIGEYLAASGRTLATLSSGTPGGGRILHHRAAVHGGLRVAMHRPDATEPPAAMDEIVKRIGPIPTHEIPSLHWLGWASDAWMQYIEPVVQPDVGILWFCEPDSSYHYCGIGSEQNLAAIAEADRQLGRLLNYCAAAIADGELQIITLSDHGQLAVRGEAVDIAGALCAAGLRVGAIPGDETDVAISVDSAGGLFCRNKDAGIIERVVTCLSAQPWCGALASADGSAGLRLADIGLFGERAPDVALVLKSDNAPGPRGWPGSSAHDASYPTGGGIHGGLHPVELHNWMSLAGSKFDSQRVITTPAGIVDVLPTALHVLGIDAPAAIDGRVLAEALSEETRSQEAPGISPATEDIPPVATVEQLGRHPARLQVTRYGPSRYLDGIKPAP